MPVYGTSLAKNTRDFTSNPWCLWVSDISFLRNEDMEDTDERESDVLSFIFSEGEGVGAAGCITAFFFSFACRLGRGRGEGARVNQPKSCESYAEF